MFCLLAKVHNRDVKIHFAFVNRFGQRVVVPILPPERVSVTRSTLIDNTICCGSQEPRSEIRTLPGQMALRIFILNTHCGVD
jgi:hypothetical protein